MTRDEALEALRKMRDVPGGIRDAEADHLFADQILLALIGDREIEAAFSEIRKWYA